MNKKLYLLVLVALVMSVFAAACGKKDTDIQKAVQDKLTADGVTGVTASVKDGIATLSGEVADITVKTKAENSAKGVEGVKSVANNISLKPLPTPTPLSTTDQALKGKLEENLKKGGCTGAVVEKVENGKVSLSGTVPEAKYPECIQIINQAGIMGFDKNDLKKGK
jgi:hyperosmotically inducible periplasmic protein